MAGDACKIINDRDLATILEKANKSTDVAEIDRVAECRRTVPRTGTPMPRKTIDNRLVYASERNAPSIQPKQEMPRQGAVSPRPPRIALRTEMMKKRSNKRFSWLCGASVHWIACRGRVFCRSHADSP
jgi:hypothetical protein